MSYLINALLSNKSLRQCQNVEPGSEVAYSLGAQLSAVVLEHMLEGVSPTKEDSEM